MADKILCDILNNIISIESLTEWLCDRYAIEEEFRPFKNYECSQVEFASYFLTFLREQSSRDYQIHDAETPLKNSIAKKIHNSNSTPDQFQYSVQMKNSQNESQKNLENNITLDLDSLQSFPSLSSCSSVNYKSSEKKLLDSSFNNSLPDNLSEEGEKNSTKTKLFSETLGGNFKEKDLSEKKDSLYFNEIYHNHEKNVAMSTPKLTKNSSLTSIDNFNMSGLQEISPKSGSKLKWKNSDIYFSNPEIDTLAPSNKSPSNNSDICCKKKENKINSRMSLGDFILSDLNVDSKKDKKLKIKKKLVPIKVNNQGQVNENCIPNKKTEDFLDDKIIYNEESHKNENESSSKLNCKKKSEGIILQNEKNIMKEKKLTTYVSTVVEKRQEAEIKLATFTAELKIFSRIYSCLISEKYCQNLMIELCFIISLLVIEDCDRKMIEDQISLDFSDRKFFGSIHNCVYFAVETLWLQRNCLLHLNLATLKLLKENARLEKFNVNLKEFILNAYNDKQSNEDIKRHHGLIKSGMQGNVSFQYETDNRENFTSNISFHSFRKQRDLFYNILAIWEASHLASGWIFSVGLGSKIKSLLSISSDPINLLHLARLFRNQLIMSCCGENQGEEDSNEKILQLFPGADPNKILRLRARLISSPKRQGPCPLPDFSGHQEFYKDFIVCANNGLFYEHLKNSLCDEILRLNDCDFIGEVEENDISLDIQTQERYLQYINILRLLAKFLGFVEFLPYRGEKPLSNHILNIHCSVMSNTQPHFDVTGCLLTALKKQKLTLTIPWMICYLSMIDPYSAHLNVYQSIWRLLVVIYKNLKKFKNEKNVFYLSLNLGWIFQLSIFPQNLFYSALDDSNKKFLEFVDPVSLNEERLGLDFYNFLEETIIYSVCPYLNEINVILSENRCTNVRHVRPLTTQEIGFNKFHTSKHLELRLEGNFLHNQSSSTRKTIEFVTERVASISIRHLIRYMLPEIKEYAFTEQTNFSLTDSAETEKLSEMAAEYCYKKMLATCEKKNWEICWKHASMALRALLSNDLQEPVIDICAKIVTRQASEKVERWIQSHLTLAMVKKEFRAIIKKSSSKTSLEPSNSPKLSENIPSKNNFCSTINEDCGQGDRKAWPLSEAVKAIRDLIRKITEKETEVEEIERIIEETIQTLERRNDIISAAKKSILCLTVDLIVMYCIQTKENDLKKIFKKFFLLLEKLRNHLPGSLERIICPRNVVIIFETSKKKENSWKNLGNLLLSLLYENLLTSEQFESQLLSLLRHNWGQEYYNYFAKFIQEILDCYVKEKGCDKTSILLEYMIETFNEDDSTSYGLVE